MYWAKELLYAFRDITYKSTYNIEKVSLKNVFVSDVGIKIYLKKVKFGEQRDGTFDYHLQIESQLLKLYAKLLIEMLTNREDFIDFDNLEIDGAMGSSSSSSNPFSSIIGRENRERDAYLERLKNVDLSTPVDRNSSASSSSAYGGIEGINNLTQSIISSPESSMKRNSSYNSGASGSSGSSGGGGGIYGSVPSSGSGGKISAISMLAASALNKPEKKPEPILEPQVEKKTQFQNTSQFHDNSQFHNNLESIAPSNMRNTHSSTNSRVSNGKSVFEDLARDEISSVSSSGNMMRNNSFSNSNLKNSSASFSDNYREELENQEQEYDEDIFSSKSNRNHNRNDFSSNSSSFSNSSDDFEDDYGSSPKSFDDMFEDERSQDNFSHKNQSYSSSRPDFDMDDEMNDEDDSSQRSYSQNNPSNYFDDDYQNSLNSSKNMNNGGNRSNDFSFNQTNRNVNYNLKSSSIKLLTNPNIVNSGHYFVDHSSLSKVRNGNVFLMTTNLEDLENPNKNYVVPISIMERSQIDDNVYLLVNSTNEYFLIDEEMGAKYFLNLTFIDSSVKRNFLLETINRLGKLSLMISKEDINLLDGCMDAIENIFIRDLNSNEEYERIKNKINSLSR
ncbi:MAG: hypothetical protein KC589_00630 [Nanoarchaeota archaeon]|nr:hypothetical protein [Nanoarchaeota archaeon]